MKMFSAAWNTYVLKYDLRVAFMLRDKGGVFHLCCEIQEEYPIYFDKIHQNIWNSTFLSTFPV